MYSGATVFSQLIQQLPWWRFQDLVYRYQGDYKVMTFRCAEQFRVMAFAQLTCRESLRDIEACPRAMSPKLYHLGIRSTVSRNNLSNANENRDWRIYAEFLLVTEGKVHDVNVLDHLVPIPGAYYVMDRGYLDFERLYTLHTLKAYFVIRAKKNFQFQLRYSGPVDRCTGLICEQTIVLTGYYPRQHNPEVLRRIKNHDPDGRIPVFLTNDFSLPALMVANLYKGRWQIELFFKWIKQHPRIKAFYGTSENAVKTQIWIAICVYLLVAITKKRLNVEQSLYTILQILSVSVFEKMSLLQAFQRADYSNGGGGFCNQFPLWD